VSAARHAHELDARERNPFAVVNAVLAVAAATIWLVALPAARDEPSPQRSPAALPLVHEDISGEEEASPLMPASVFHK
jgi:hypothetical protein